jgi:hypothetical protein
MKMVHFADSPEATHTRCGVAVAKDADGCDTLALVFGDLDLWNVAFRDIRRCQRCIRSVRKTP